MKQSLRWMSVFEGKLQNENIYSAKKERLNKIIFNSLYYYRIETTMKLSKNEELCDWTFRTFRNKN